MIIAAMVCLLVAVVAVSVGICFISNKSLRFLFDGLLLVLLILLGVCSACQTNDFSGFSIFAFVSIVPMFLNIYLIQISSQSTNKFIEKYGTIFKNSAYLVSSVCIYFCGLYCGKESGIAILIALALGLFGTFLEKIIKKSEQQKPLQIFLNYLERFIMFFSVGIALSAALLAVCYTFSISNLLFMFGAICLAAHTLLENYLQSKFDHFAFVASYILIFIAIII